MRVPLTEELLREIEGYSLRSACGDCLYYLEGSGACLHHWPNDEQRRWPVEAPLENGERPREVAFCKEFELR